LSGIKRETLLRVTIRLLALLLGGLASRLLVFFHCFLLLLAAFLYVFCCFLASTIDWRAYSATPGLCALAGIDHATLKATSNVKRGVRLIRKFHFDFERR
jgi:hypothetical protein